MRYWLFACAFAILAVCASRPAPAVAGLHVCNKTSNTVYFAYARFYCTEEDCFKEVHGWWKIAPDGCRTPISADLDDLDDYYYYANDNDGGTWSDQDHKGGTYCIDPVNAFDYDSDENSTCATGSTRRFRSLSFSGTDYTLDLTP